MTVAFALGLILFALALGAFSSLLFAWQWIIGSPTQLSASILLISVLGAFLALFVYINKRAPVSIRSGRHWILPGLPFIYAIGYAGYWLFQDVKKLPHGDWDAWAIWNLHARFLYREGGDFWRYIFSPELSWNQNDYPVLLPGLVSGAWLITGTESAVIPAVLGVGFAALSIGIVCAAVSALAHDERGWLAGLVLMATPAYLLGSTYQMADIPIGLYILTTVVLLQFADAWPQVKRPVLILAGLSAGLATWMKQEGLLFVVGILGSYIAGFAILRGWRALRSNASMLILGLAPMLVLNFSFKAFLAPANHVVSVEVLQQTAENLPTINRSLQVAYGFWDQAKGFGGSSVNGVHPVVLLVLCLLLYATPIRRISPASLSLLLLIPIMLAGYFMVYLISPFGAGGFLTYSLNRLLLQMWPACLFIMATVPLSANFAVNSVTPPSTHVLTRSLKRKALPSIV